MRLTIYILKTIQKKINYIKNKSMLCNILNKNYYNTRLIHTIEQIKTNFNNAPSKRLYNNRRTYTPRVHSDFDENIKQFSHDNSQPSPSLEQQVWIYTMGG